MALDPLFGKQLGGFILALVIDAEGDVAGLGEELPSSGGGIVKQLKKLASGS